MLAAIEKVKKIYPKAKILEKYKVKEINPDLLEPVVINCSSGQKWIIQKWADYWKKKKVPYIVIDKGKKNRRRRYEIWKECKRG